MNKLQREAVIRTALELLNDVGMEGPQQGQVKNGFVNHCTSRHRNPSDS